MLFYYFCCNDKLKKIIHFISFERILQVTNPMDCRFVHKQLYDTLRDGYPKL